MAEDQLPEKFDPSKLMDGVKDRIKATFAGLIPDQVWERMVKKEVDTFFDDETHISFSIKEESDRGWSGTKTYRLECSGKMSPFKQLIYNHCISTCSEMIKKHITEEYVSSLWNPTSEDLKPKMKELVKETSQEAITGFFEKLIMESQHRTMNIIQNYRPQ